MSGITGGLSIASLAAALPAHVMQQKEAAELACTIACRSEEQRRLIEALYRRAGVRTRYTVVPHDEALRWLAAPEEDAGRSCGPTTAQRMDVYRREAPPLALAAAREALVRASMPGEVISHLVTVSCTGFHAPGFDLDLIEQLPLRPDVQRTHVGFMGCHGAINGLRVALALARSDPAARVLLSAAELCSLHYQYAWDPELLVGNAVFGDGAAALVGSACGDQSRWRVAATGSCLLPDSRDAMSWSISDHGFQMQLSARCPT